MTWHKSTTVQEYVGVLVDVLEDVQGSLDPVIILQATDEEEYFILQNDQLTPFLSQLVRIVVRINKIKKKKSLEVLEINPIQLNGTIQ